MPFSYFGLMYGLKNELASSIASTWKPVLCLTSGARVASAVAGEDPHHAAVARLVLRLSREPGADGPHARPRQALITKESRIGEERDGRRRRMLSRVGVPVAAARTGTTSVTHAPERIRP